VANRVCSVRNTDVKTLRFFIFGNRGGVSSFGFKEPIGEDRILSEEEKSENKTLSAQLLSRLPNQPYTFLASFTSQVVGSDINF
jgi:hypothetical protein